jgi:hypothetical protein
VGYRNRPSRLRKDVLQRDRLIAFICSGAPGLVRMLCYRLISRLYAPAKNFSALTSRKCALRVACAEKGSLMRIVCSPMRMGASEGGGDSKHVESCAASRLSLILTRWYDCAQATIRRLGYPKLMCCWQERGVERLHCSELRVSKG